MEYFTNFKLGILNVLSIVNRMDNNQTLVIVAMIFIVLILILYTIVKNENND